MLLILHNCAFILFKINKTDNLRFPKRVNIVQALEKEKKRRLSIKKIYREVYQDNLCKFI